MNEPARVTPAQLLKFVAVRRSSEVPTVYWWSLPLALTRVALLDAETLPGARVVVHPGTVLGAHAAEVGAQESPGGTATLRGVRQFFELRAEGLIGPCTAALFPPGVNDAELAARLPCFRSDLERLPFTLALRPRGDGRARHEFCFRVPGKVIAALEDLALGRAFGGDLGQVEIALLQGLRLRPGDTANLRLVMQQGGASLVRIEAGGRRRVTYLESGQGYTGIEAEVTLGEALRQRGRESWRRFPVGVVMFAGLPFFVAAFWAANLFRSRLPPGRPDDERARP